MADSGRTLTKTLKDIAVGATAAKQALIQLEEGLEAPRIIKYETALYDLQMRMQKSSKEMKKLKISFKDLEDAGRYTREEFAGMATELSDFSTVIGASADSMKGWLDNLQKKFPLAADKALAAIKSLRGEFRSLANDMAKGTVSGKEVATRMIAKGDFSSDSIFRAAETMDLGYGGSEDAAPLAMKKRKAHVAREGQKMDYAEKMRGVSETYYDATEKYAKTTGSLGITFEKLSTAIAGGTILSKMNDFLSGKGTGSASSGGVQKVFVTNWPGNTPGSKLSKIAPKSKVAKSAMKLAGRFTKLAGAVAITVGAMVALAKVGDLHAKEMKAQQKAIDDKHLHRRAKAAGVKPSEQRKYEKEIADIRAGKSKLSKAATDDARIKELEKKGEGREKTANELTAGEALKHSLTNNFVNPITGGERSASYKGRSPEEEAELEKLKAEQKKRNAEAEKQAVMLLGAKVKLIEEELNSAQILDSIQQSRLSHLDAMGASSLMHVSIIGKQLDIEKEAYGVELKRAAHQKEYVDAANARLGTLAKEDRANGNLVAAKLKEAEILENNNNIIRTGLRLQESKQRVAQLEVQQVEKLYKGKMELIDLDKQHIQAVEAIAKATYMAPGAQVALRMKSIEKEKEGMDAMIAKRDQLKALMAKSTGKEQSEYALKIKQANVSIVQSQAKIAQGADHIRRTWMETFSAQMMGADSGTYLMGGASQLSGMQEKGAAFRPFDDANRGGGHGTYKDIMKPFGGVLAEQRTVAERDIARNAGSGAGVIVEGALKAFSDRVAGALKGVSLGVYGQ